MSSSRHFDVSPFADAAADLRSLTAHHHEGGARPSGRPVAALLPRSGFARLLRSGLVLLLGSALMLAGSGCESSVAVDPASDLLISPAAGPSAGASATKTIVEGKLGHRLDDYFSRLAVWGFSGAVLLARGDEVLLAKGYGYADREARRPFGTDTVFTIGSITKPFTGAAILELVSQGKVSPDDPIGKYFDDVPDDKKAITVHQLLTHSAGFPGAIGDDFEPIDRDDFVRRALATPLDFPPGESYEYSNVGYSLLGAIVEKVTGEDYETFLRRELLLPAGMADTGYVLPDWAPGRVAVGYRDGERWGTFAEKPRLDDGPGWHLRANGGLHSTLWDMYRWLGVVKGVGPDDAATGTGPSQDARPASTSSAKAASAMTPVLPEEQRRLWIEPHVDEGMGDSWYGYGWTIENTPWGRIIAHNGGNGIFTADFFWFKDADLFFFGASNSSLARIASMRGDIARAIFEPDASLPEIPAAYAGQVAAGPAAVAASRSSRPVLAAGMYALSDGTRLSIVTDDGRLRFQPTGQGMLDALFDTPEPQRERFAGYDRKAQAVWTALAADDPTAFRPVSESDEQAAGRAERMARFLKERARDFGAFDGIELIGTTPVRPLPGLPPEAAATTWGRVHFARDSVTFGMLWDGHGDYIGTTIGPLEDLPSATLVPLPPTSEAGDGDDISAEPSAGRAAGGSSSGQTTGTSSAGQAAGASGLAYQGRLTGFPGLTSIIPATPGPDGHPCLQIGIEKLCPVDTGGD